VAGSTQPLRGCIRGSAQPRTPDSTANLVFSQPTSLRRSECGQCTPCTGHPHGYTIPVQKSVCTGHPTNKSRDASRPPFFFYHPQLSAIALNSRAFGTEITGNRGPNQELLKEARSSIISAILAGTPKAKIAYDYYIHHNTITRTLERV